VADDLTDADIGLRLLADILAEVRQIRALLEDDGEQAEED
jgi:hypothetical protein